MQKADPGLNVVEVHLKSHWVHQDLIPVQPLVARMLSLESKERPLAHDVNCDLRKMFPEATQAVEEWLHEDQEAASSTGNIDSVK